MRDGRRWIRIGVVLLALGSMGMGGLGGGRETGLPPRDYRAALTDADGTRVDVTHLTAGGDTSLEGEIGRGRLRIPFDNVKSIRFQPIADDRDHVRAEIHLREGDPATLLIRNSTTFYGQVPSGAYQIRARDLKAIELAQ